MGAALSLLVLLVSLVASARSPNPRSDVLGLVSALAHAVVVLIPALILGATWGGASQILDTTRAAIGLREVVSPTWAASVAVALTFALIRLPLSFRRDPSGLRGLLLIGLALVIASAIASHYALTYAGAALGAERWAKGLLLFLALSLFFAALASPTAGRALDRRTLLLGCGLVITAFSSLHYTIRYLNPGADAIERVLLSWDSDGQVFLAAELEDRPDLHGLFVLSNASATPRLATVRRASDLVDDRSFLPVRSTGFGDVYVTASVERTDRSIAHEAHFLELWFRSRFWPYMGSRLGVRVPHAMNLWASSRGSFLSSVSTPAPLPGGHRDPCGARTGYGLEIAWPTPFGYRRARLLESPGYPVILDVRDRRARVVVDLFGAKPPLTSTRREAGLTLEPIPETETNAASVSESGVACCVASPGPTELGFATYDMSADRWSDWSFSDRVTESFSTKLLASGDALLSRCRASQQPGSGWCIVELPSLNVRAQLPVIAGAASYQDVAFPLRSGGLIRFALTAYRPLTKQAFVYDANGWQVGVHSIAAEEEALFCGELASGEILLRRNRGANRNVLFRPIPGWSVDAWDPQTGSLRSIATDLSAFWGQQHGSTCLFLDNSGRLVSLSEGSVALVPL